VAKWLGHYLLLYAATVIACWRIGKDAPQALRYFLIDSRCSVC